MKFYSDLFYQLRSLIFWVNQIGRHLTQIEMLGDILYSLLNCMIEADLDTLVMHETFCNE